MMSAITGGLGSLKTALDVAKGLNATITEAKVAEAKTQIIGHLITAQQAMLDAQQTLLEDTDTIRALEAEIMGLKDWQTEAARYELADAGQRTVAYRLKQGEGTGEPAHWLCPNCFADGKKSFLIPETHMWVRTLVCHRCKWEGIVTGKAANYRKGQ